MFAATDSDTVPLALPLAPEAIAIQPAPLVAVQLQPESVETLTEMRPPLAPIASLAGLMEKRHGAPAWLSGTLWPPTAIAPLRAAGDGFAATLYATVPSPWPLAPPPIAIQLVDVLTDHVQSRAAPTVRLPLPPFGGNDVVALATLTWHLSAVGVVTAVPVDVEVQAAVAHTTAAATAAATRFCIIAFTRASNDARASPTEKLFRRRCTRGMCDTIRVSPWNTA